jgi:hypothetical protein
MLTTNDLISTTYREAFDNAQACTEYDQWLDAEDTRRRELAEARRVFHIYCRTQEDVESDPDYDDGF